MSSASDSTQESDTGLGDQALGGFGYGLGLSLAVLIVFVFIAYASYKCKQSERRSAAAVRHRSPAVTDTDEGGASIITIQHDGLDAATLASYPQYTYSQLKPHKSESAASGCAICLADYKDSDLLRLLPECGHLFHRSCIDPWLMIQPTCPICRNSPLPTPVHHTPLAQPAPVAITQ